MRFTVENIFTTLLLMLAEAWFLHGLFAGQPSWDSSLALLAALAAFFGKDYVKEKLNIAQPAREHDRALYLQFLAELPVEPAITMLKDYDFGNAFKYTHMRSLFNFSETWDTVEKEFLDKKLEEQRKSLVTAAQELSIEFAKLTVPVGNGDFSSVFPDRLRAEGPRPEFVIEDARQLNRAARSFVPLYESFVRACRQKLMA
ncbi:MULTISPECIES: hypothetical protein [Xanthomonas]|uniref:hypothetical protein n=1 Tax=Xanthomonas TaxID=338 RepID=UPI0011B0A142|nr:MULTISPECIES: hypothetical protein [Xanthomonas]CAG2091171.1 hypothetical protein XCY_002362 [Xanthomonas euroxanthea]CAG2091679.1 hypothetical protein XCY_002499 [Xanthomonas arboricola pv. juglandis]